jgi:predicted ferric reductase
MNQKIKSNIALTALIGFFIFCSIIFSYMVFNSLNDFSLNSLFSAIGKLAGLVGFVFLSVLIFSGDTARFFDRFFGMDKIIKFQRKFSLVTFIVVIFHPLFFILSGSPIEILFPNFAFIPLSVGVLAFYILICVYFSSVGYKRISHKVWQYLHILTYILFFFALYHAVNTGSDSQNIFFKIIFWTLSFAIVLGIIYRTWYKFKHRKDRFIVKKINWETENVFTIEIEPQQKFSFEAGQFCFLRLNKNKLYARHPFTISSSPNEKNLKFAVKIEGRFTKAVSELKNGEEIFIDGPFGIFTAEENKNLVFIAGGVGITPFISIIKNNLNKKEKITLLYSSKTEKDIIFKKELDKIKKPWFRKIYLLRERKKGNEFGYFTKELIEKYVFDFDNSLFYICGPERMKKSVEEILKSLGAKKKNIFFEDFFW